MPNDEMSDESGCIDWYLPWSGDVPTECRLAPERAAEAAEMPDEPIVDAVVLEEISEYPRILLRAIFGKPWEDSDYALLLTLT